MTLRKIGISALFVLALCLSVFAAQEQRLKIVPDPLAIGVKGMDSLIRIEWVQLSSVGSQDLLTPEFTGDIYYSSTPAGGDLSKYTRISALVANNQAHREVGNVISRRSSFRPRAAGITPGTYYCIVASVSGQDTLYSDYFTLMVESAHAPELIAPKANILAGELVTTINQLTPQFSWRRVPGVPYYHIILSDQPIIGPDGALAPTLSVIWQAITPATSIAYGSPDPSGTLTASPPPLSPGTTYSWLVLNNYGNHMAFNSRVINPMDVVQGQFRISGTPIAAPRIVPLAPPSGGLFSGTQPITFQWTNLAPEANSFLVNLSTVTPAQNLGADLGTVSASLLVWETTVSRGSLARGDTLSVDFDAAGTLSSGNYTWRVYALDSRGAAATNAQSAGTFGYSGSNGAVTVRTRESFGRGAFESAVGFVELRTEVLSGPMQAPLAFYTDNNGDHVGRDFPEGRYRITAVKEGYNSQSATIDVRAGATTLVPTFYMTRPEAIIYGQVLAQDGSVISQARVTAISEWGDTLTALTSGSGSFTISCNAAAWTVTVEKAGYRTTLPERVTLRLGDNRNFGTVRLVRNDHSLSGVVRNSSGDPLIGARVRVLTRDGVLIDELASTSHHGVFEFYLNSGTYILTAEKAGFSMFSRTVAVTGSNVLDVTLPEGAALLNGIVIGRSWDAGRDGDNGAFVSAPVPSAVIRLWDNAGDTLMVTSDPTFGRFSISLPVGKEYKVRVSAAGFDNAASDKEVSTVGIDAGGGTMPQFTDTLVARLAIKGTVTHDVQPLGGADVFVYDENNRVVASARTAANGTYEVRNIPSNALYTVGAGRDGFYMLGDRISLSVLDGRPEENVLSYDFTMDTGDKSIIWNIADRAALGIDTGTVKVVSPFHRTVKFDYRNAGDPLVARVSNVGPGDYVIEAVAESNPRLLELSHQWFSLRQDADETVAITVNFPFEHVRRDTLAMVDGRYELDVRGVTALPGVSVTTVELFYRNEGRTNFTRAAANISSAIPVDRIPFPVNFTPADGSNLFYYFRVHLSDGRIYGSQKQLFRTFVKPEPTIISRISVNPGAGRDALTMPSSYAARFTFNAFFSDRYEAVDPDILRSGAAGTVQWSVYDAGSVVESRSGIVFEYTTPTDEKNLVLRAVFTPAGAYSMKNGVSATLEMPLRVTGSALDNIAVMRRGGSGWISSSGTAGFRAQALDKDGNQVTVTPVWSVLPAGAGVMSDDGTFSPASDFFGTARITASIPGRGGLSAEYTEDGAAAPGQVVKYSLRHSNTAATINTRNGLRFEFPARSVQGDRFADFDVEIPELKNYVHRGSDGYRMADSIAFDVVITEFEAIDSAITIVLDIPAFLRGGDQELKIAKWFPDSLKWSPIPNSEIVNNGAAVSAVLRNEAREGMGKRAAAANAQRAATFGEFGRYALVVKTLSLTASMSISPHPFSPYIRPVREYGASAPAGTCIKVNVDAPDGLVRSVKVHIYNSLGTRVWAVDKMNAPTGENRFWWDGRTSGRSSGRTAVNEEVCTCNSHNCICLLDRDRPMLRNGRYFVKVTVTDLHGERKRMMKPVVLMK